VHIALKTLRVKVHRHPDADTQQRTRCTPRPSLLLSAPAGTSPQSPRTPCPPPPWETRCRWGSTSTGHPRADLGSRSLESSTPHRPEETGKGEGGKAGIVAGLGDGQWAQGGSGGGRGAGGVGRGIRAGKGRRGGRRWRDTSGTSGAISMIKNMYTRDYTRVKVRNETVHPPHVLPAGSMWETHTHTKNVQLKRIPPHPFLRPHTSLPPVIPPKLHLLKYFESSPRRMHHRFGPASCPWQPHKRRRPGTQPLRPRGGPHPPRRPLHHCHPHPHHHPHHPHHHRRRRRCYLRRDQHHPQDRSPSFPFDQQGQSQGQRTAYAPPNLQTLRSAADCPACQRLESLECRQGHRTQPVICQKGRGALQRGARIIVTFWTCVKLFVTDKNVNLTWEGVG
jgi:hypothetical protein